jgi:hypothetical protein
MKNDQWIDAVQTVGIVTIAIVLSYVVVVLEGTLNRCADRLKKVLIHQDKIIEATDRMGRGIETIEAVLDANKAAIKALSNQLNGKRYEGSSNRGLVADGPVRPILVVVLAPILQLFAGVGKR